MRTPIPLQPPAHNPANSYAHAGSNDLCQGQGLRVCGVVARAAARVWCVGICSACLVGVCPAVVWRRVRFRHRSASRAFMHALGRQRWRACSLRWQCYRPLWICLCITHPHARGYCGCVCVLGLASLAACAFGAAGPGCSTCEAGCEWGWGCDCGCGVRAPV